MPRTKGAKNKNKGGRPIVHTEEQVAAAIRAEHGIMYMVADRLKVEYRTIVNYLDRWPDLRRIKQESITRVNGKAKQNIVKAIEKGGIEISKYWLAHKCRNEFGDVRRTETMIGGLKGAPPIMNANLNAAIKELTPEQQNAILAILEQGEKDE